MKEDNMEQMEFLLDDDRLKKSVQEIKIFKHT